MGVSARGVTLWVALAVAAAGIGSARGYTVDCNHEYTDCDTELSKLEGGEEDEFIGSTTNLEPSIVTTPPPFLPTILPETSNKADSRTKGENKLKPEDREPSETNGQETDDIPKRPRLLNLNVDENLQNFANVLHNQTLAKNSKIDLSDVNMEEEDEEEKDLRRVVVSDSKKHGKPIPNKFYSNLQVPFNPLSGIDNGSDEQDTCKENEVIYKIGERIDRGCEETCECQPGGTFECSPRCKHPYIRKGRRLSDPLCFESPVDECCSIIACATGNQDVKTKIEICRYNNETHAVGEKWHIGCDQTCSCETNSVVTCKPRCKKLSPSEKCINVQDPKDECCEVQICDVSQDVHEEPENVTSSTTTTARSIMEGMHSLFDYDSLHHSTTSEIPTGTPNPIGSVKVLQNNTVQVNLINMNSSETPTYVQLSSDGGKNFDDVELKYSNLILNLPGGKDYILKSKESGKKFNFTITAAIDTENDTVKIEETKEGCFQDGLFYAVGEEFHIGCSQLCECTGANTRDCVDLVCPSHVGLELVSKGCVRWAPSPPATPPNCCPRAARCLSDGTCHYKGNAVPNWSEVPISLTGCEQRCFCENGELDCQEVCTPLPPLPPQTLRCPPQHHPAPVNISDEDCCKHWACVPNAEKEPRKWKFIEPIGVAYNDLNTSQEIYTSNLPTTTEADLNKLDANKTSQMRYALSKIVNSFKYRPVSPIGTKTQTNPIDQAKVYSNKYKHGDIIHSAYTKVIQPVPASKNNVKYPKVLSGKFNHQKIKIDELLREFDDHETQRDPLNFRPSQISPGAAKSKYQDEKFLSEFQRPTDYMSRDNLFYPLRDNFGYMIPISRDGKKRNMDYFPPAAPRRALTDTPYKLKNSSHYKDINVFAPNNLLRTNEKANRSRFNYYNKNNDYLQHLIKKLKNEISLKVHSPGYAPVETTTVSLISNRITNPYEPVLMKPVNVVKPKSSRVPSPLGFDQLVSQMELDPEVNRNLGRSADNNKKMCFGAGKQTPAPDSSTPVHVPAGQAPFLPTIPPMIHFPTEDIPDYDENNLHRPVNTREPPALPGLPPGLSLPPNYGEENKKLSVLSIQADSPTSIKLLFGLPPVLVGLRGSVDLRYTDKADDDISLWYSQVFAPADEVLTTPRLEFRLTGLKPSTIYKIKGKLFLHNLPVEPESQVYSIRTLDLPTVMPPIEEKRREVDSRLILVDVNDTAAHVSWRHFSEDELQFIDGIQVRYRPKGTPIYSMTELLHHSRTIAELHDLRPGTKYEASLVLIPPPRATTELHDPGIVEFTTSPFVDPYNWSVTIEAHVVGSSAAELTWHGVPSPAERWVRVYRAAHACGASRHEHDAFRLAARDLPPTIMLTGLEANTRCRVWMELFLTNGKIKTSNVLEINTRPEDQPKEIDNEIEASSIAGARGEGRGDYYGSLVVVGVVAALGAVTSLLLLLILVRRHRPRSVPITPVPSAPRESSLPPYDNPAYKLELQQETMDL